MSWGVCYQGSKSRIAERIVSTLPSGKRLVDLFAGGCAVSHCAAESGKYETCLANDLYPSGINLFRQALRGECNEPSFFRWISREEFFARKDENDFVRLVYSFGNDGTTYLYSRENETIKRAFHFAVVFDEWEQFAALSLPDDFKAEARASLARFPLGGASWSIQIHARRKAMQRLGARHGIKPLKLLESLQRLGRLQNLERPQGEQGFVFAAMDYRDYRHMEGDVVYCDLPYRGTKHYSGRTFDHDVFYEWARTRPYTVWFTEYEAPPDFEEVMRLDVPRLMSGGRSAHKKATERLFASRKSAISQKT